MALLISTRTRPPIPTPRDLAIVVGLVLAGLVLRMVFPEADPLHPRWLGWMTDEGRWTEVAREWALFRSPDLDSPVSGIHLILAPLYQGVTALVFEVVDVSLVSARLVSRVAGIGLLLGVAIGLRRCLQPRAWIAAVALVAFHPELVYFSRVAIPEMPALAVAATAFFLLVRPVPTRSTDMLAGALAVVAVGFKGTVAPILLGFAVIPLLVGSADDSPRPLERLRAWAIGVGVPMLAAGTVALMTTGLPGQSNSLDAILGFIELNRPYAIGASLLLSSAFDEANLLLAALAPLSAMVWVLSPPDSPARRLYLGALAWVGTWLVLGAGLAYFPGRYMVHMHFALILAVAGAVSLLTGVRVDVLRERLAALSTLQRIVIGTLAAAPLAAVVVPAGLVGLDSLGMRLERVRVFLPLLVLVAVGTGWFAIRRGSPSLAGGAVAAFPWAATLVWHGIHGPAADKWWSIDASTVLGPWAVAVGAGAVAALIVDRRARGHGLPAGLSNWAMAYLAGLVILWSGGRHLALITRPTHVLSEISQDLAQLYAAGEPVGVSLLATALIDTPYRYVEVFDARRLPSRMILSESSRGLVIDDEALADYSTVREYSIPLFRYRGQARPVGPPVGARRHVEIVERTGAEGGER